MEATAQINREAKRLYRLCLVDGALREDRVLSVVHQILASSMRSSIVVLRRFQRLVRLHLESHTANVETATQLPMELEADVRARIEALYGRGISTQFALKPSLIGGMRIKVGSNVYDQSVQSKLQLLEKSFEA